MERIAWSRAPTAALDAHEAAALRALAADLLEDVSAISEHLTAHVMREVRALDVPGDPTWPATVYRAARANASAILAMLAEGVPGATAETPVEARAFYERQAEHDDGLVTVLRTYRLGIAELWQIWAAHVAAHTPDAARRHVILTSSFHEITRYQDRMAEESATHWRETRMRKRRGLDRSPAEIVRAALAGGRAEDLEQLGYDVQAEHVAIALRADAPTEAAEALAARVRARLALGTVILAHDEAHVVWVAVGRAITDDRLAELIGDGPAGISTRHAGITGFRVSHREAVDALRVGTLRGTPGVTCHDDIALVAALSADPERARALVRREIGPLLGDADTARRLRETLLAYLAAGESHVRAAERLGVHEKTVTYRVRRAEELLGRRTADRRAELEAALLLQGALGD